MTGSYYLSEDELLQPQNMLNLYAKGAFPMADEVTGEINWYLPKRRTIIPLDNFNYPRSLRKFIEKSDFEIKYDTDFPSVVKGCADRNITWISPKLIKAYLNLEALGHVHTVETWRKHKLVGGLYGITIRGAFFGESMFSYESQASKTALINLLYHLNEKGFVLLDVQYITEHLKMFGAIQISFKRFQNLLNIAFEKKCRF